VELSQVWRAVMRRWVVCALVLALSLVGAAYVAYSAPNRYQATATVLVEPSDTSGAGNFAAVTFLLPSLQVQLTTSSIARAAADRVPAGVRAEPVGVASTVEQGTGVLRITATGPRARAVAPWANAYASALVASQPSDGPLRLLPIDPAAPPGGPSGPARASTLVSGVALGLILAVALALALEWLARRRYLRGEIRERLGVPVLGEIPRMRRPGRGLSAPGILAGNDAYLVESFMRARTSIELQLATRHVGVVCVTSLDNGEGTSTVASTLAWALASAGHGVTLIEADVREPVLRQLVATPGSPTAPAELGTRVGVGDGSGPSLLLVEAADLVSVAETALSAGRRALHPAEVVTVGLPYALRALHDPTAVVLIDAPPLLRAAEASLASRAAAGVVVVVDVTRRHVLDRVEHALARVEDAGGTVIGVVLNRTRRGRAEELERAIVAPGATAPAGPALAPPRPSAGREGVAAAALRPERPAADRPQDPHPVSSSD
jgi:polysaccharide biosynthesis transport protein